MSSFLRSWWSTARQRISGDGEDGPEALESARAAASARARATLAVHPWPPDLLAALERLRTESARAYLVGGTVRDVLLGRSGGEAIADVATALEPAAVVQRFERVVPIGIEHGTVLIVLPGMRIECTTFRTEGPYPDARHPEHVAFGHDPVADLARRDLTVNAMAFDPAEGVLLDPHGGALDLERRVLRAVGDPEERFREDALRPLRVARFAATLEMAPEPATRSALGRVADRARRISWERVKGELDRLLAADHPSIGLDLLHEAGLLEVWLPELERTVGVVQNRWHAHDVYVHSLETCDAAPREKPRVRWAALLHDIGKPDTKVVRDGEGTFYDHQIVGARMADRLLQRLRAPAEERAAIVHLVREHMFDYRPEWSDAALRRWIRRVGVEAIADLFDLRIADYLGNGLRAGFPSYLETMRRRIEALLAESRALHVADLAVDGRDVMRVLGIPPGPRVGATLEALLERVIDHPDTNVRERLLEALETMKIVRP